MEKNEVTRPVWSGKAGTVEVSVWENTTKEGGTFEVATITKNYFDKATDSWKKGNNFHKHDLPMLRMLLNDAYRHMVVKYLPKKDVN